MSSRQGRRYAGNCNRTGHYRPLPRCELRVVVTEEQQREAETFPESTRRGSGQAPEGFKPRPLGNARLRSWSGVLGGITIRPGES